MNRISEGAKPCGPCDATSTRRHIDYMRSNSALCRPGDAVGAGSAR